MVTGSWLLAVATTVLALTSASSFSLQVPAYLYRQTGRDSPMKIRPKPCVNARGHRGQCMFVWDCIKSEGEHLGTCVDGFLFGSCCGHDVHHNVLGGGSGGSDKPVEDEDDDDEEAAAATGATAATMTMLSLSSSTSSVGLPMVSTSTPTTTEQIEVLREGVTNVTSVAGDVVDADVVVDHSATTHNWTSSAVSVVLHISGGGNQSEVTSWTVDYFDNNKTTSAAAAATSTSATTMTTTTMEPTMEMLPTAVHLMSPSSTTMLETTTMAAATTTTTTTSTTTATLATSPTTVRTITTVTMATMPSTTPGFERRTMETIAAAVMVPSKVFHDCGVSAMLPQMRIVGGKNSLFGEWPWQVSVRRSTFFGFSSTHRCGGAVLNENWIATAGHCVADLLLAQIRIRVGEYDLSSTEEPEPFVERSVQKKVVHPKYNADTYEYDLALIRLDKPLAPADNVAPICLPSGDPILVGESATITGWGRLKEGGTLPSILQEVRVPIMSNKKCEQMFMATGRRENIPNFFICAGFEKGGKDSCQGDSGGPLQLKSEDGRWILAGIISWGIGCGEPNLPGVCTRISKFREWILNKIDKEGV